PDTHALSLHDALPICGDRVERRGEDDPGDDAGPHQGGESTSRRERPFPHIRKGTIRPSIVWSKVRNDRDGGGAAGRIGQGAGLRSEEHTSELQSRENL